jgi:ubiquinone/menaquinone biosynthesis C-methylase UbiE
MAIHNSNQHAPVHQAQVRNAVAADRLPDYAERMAAFHREFAAELHAMIADAWPAGAKQVLDLACGDGCYSTWLSEQAGDLGQIWAVDVSRDWLEVTRRSSRRGGVASQVRSIAADALRLPFDDETFDFVWCAQSLYSLPDASSVLRDLYRVLRRGGRVALLENDTLHQLLLPWSVELEQTVREAEWRAVRRCSSDAARFYIGRNLQRILCEAGFTRCQKRTHASNRGGPLSGDMRAFVQGYLQSLRCQVQDDLKAAELDAFDRLLRPGEEDCFFDDPSITITSIDHVVWGDKPV